MINGLPKVPDVFISYSSSDRQLADFVHRHLRDEGLEVFMASVSLSPGDVWDERIRRALNEAKWVVVLASRAACDSGYVQQELGGAWLGAKKVIPIVWDMPPTELPDSIRKFQALDLRDATADDAQEQVASIADAIRLDKQKTQLIAGLVLGGLVYLVFRQ